ncbi:MAG TPA: TonB-dependent receptor [Rhizomicrobium sp.]|jgi:iron complex outermembrane receptor protein
MSKITLRSREALVALACMAAASAWSMPARAQTSSGAPAAGGVEEVVVTAERRATDVQKTPLAITAVSAATLDKSFVTQVADLNGTVPSLQSTKTSGFENIVTIRGVGSETPENDLTTVPGTSLFVDGVYVVNTISLSQTLFDVDHIEVLRGPQGALYGQSSIGGAINIDTKQPDLSGFGGQADFSYGTYNLTRERVELNVPIDDTVAVRGSVQRFDHKGFTTDTAIPGFREDDAHNTGYKGAILWQPTENFSATLTGQWYDADEHGQAQKNVNDPNKSPWRISQDYPSKSKLTTELYHLNLSYQAPWFTIKSVSAYQHMNSVLQEDSDRSTFAQIGAYDHVAGWNTKLRSYTEEFDILSNPGSQLEWIVGFFWLKQSSDQFVAEFEGFGAAPGSPGNIVAVTPGIENPPYPPNLAYGNDSLVKRRSQSFFAQATYHVTDNFRITAGGRLNHDSYSDDSFNFSAFNPPPGYNTVFNKTKDDVTTWRAEADYDLSPVNLLYASYSRGYKPGGVNGSYGQIVIPPAFEPETNTAIEVGSKNFFFDDSVRLNLAAFDYQYKNMQYIETDPRPFDGGISNIPKVHIHGIEAEASYVSPDNHWHLNGNLALEEGSIQGNYSTIDSTVANTIIATSPNCAFNGQYYNPACWADIIAGAKNIKGNSPPAMPKTSGSFDVSYSFFDVWSGTLTPRVQYVYRGSMWARIFNEPGLDTVKAYNVFNANIDYVPDNSNFTISLIGTNLFETHGVNSKYIDPYGTGTVSQQFISPRQIILTVGYKF